MKPPSGVQTLVEVVDDEVMKLMDLMGRWTDAHTSSMNRLRQGGNHIKKDSSEVIGSQ